MIVSFRDKRTREFAEGNRVKAFARVERTAEMRPGQLDSATSLRDVNLPGSHFEVLKGDRKGQYSILINKQRRVCFEWPKGAIGPINVEIVDYH